MYTGFTPKPAYAGDPSVASLPQDDNMREPARNDPRYQIFMKTSRQHLGASGEDIACEYYKKLGYKLIARNVRVASGEIDLIFKKNKFIYFVEVKTRSSTLFGYPEDAINETKQLRMYRCAYNFLKLNPLCKPHHMRLHVCAVIQDGENHSIRLYTEI